MSEVANVAKKLAAALEPALMAALSGLALAAGPVAPLAEAAITAGDAAIRKNNPDYFPGVATVASVPPVQTLPGVAAAVPSVDTSASPLAKEPSDLESLIAYTIALNAKVDALIEANGLGNSASMADHA